MANTYDVVLLCEQALSEEDATQVTSLHEDLEEQVVYHVLMPVEDAAARVEAAMGSLSAGEVMAAPAMAIGEIDLAEVRKECLEHSERELETTLKVLKAAGAKADGTISHEHPVDALAGAVTKVDGREVIILTRPHVVAEFFHVDWTSRARRKIGVPVLHLLERETFEEQGEGFGEGVTGV
ncbi:hypothetical protein ASG90_12960 [Nocardioides sp. Soil797]|nr:hypothetical protein ASG90_12960 [Nocardioides sp. Soil797]